MISIRNVFNIAKYESLVLWRNWFFRIVALAGLVFVTIFSLGVFSEVGNPRWEVLANSWIMPHAVMILIAIPQAAAVIFLATGLIKKDKKIDTNEVFFVRSMSNLDYVLGKAMALFKLFFLLNYVLLLIPLIVNLTNPNIQLNIVAFIIYPLLISVPNIVFITGLSFLLVTLLKNQPIAIVLMVGLAGVQLIYYFDQFSNILDFTAFRLPLLFSEISGPVDLGFALRQRAFYALTGIAFLFLTSFFLDRLSNHRRYQIASGLMAIVILGICANVMVGLWSSRNEVLTRRQAFIAENDKWANTPNITIVSHHIELEQVKNEISCTSNIKAKNSDNQPLKTIYFTLNPELEIDLIKVKGQSVKFSRTSQIIALDEGINLASNEFVDIQIVYHGGIDQSIAHLEVDPFRYEEAKNHFMLNLQKQYAFLQEDYVLLTKDVLWYPDTQIGYNHEAPMEPKEALIHFQLNVKPEEGLMPISQGAMTLTDGTYQFQPEYPLPQLSLVIGAYVKKEISVDSISYEVYHYPDNDHFATELALIADTLDVLIKDIVSAYEVDLQMHYPFRRLQFVETPLQYTAYNKIYESHQSFLQPETVYWPEEGGNIRAFDFKRQMRDMNWQAKQRNETLSEKDKQANLFSDLIKKVFTKQSGDTWFLEGRDTDDPDYSLFANYYDFNTGVISKDWPLFDQSIAKYLRNDQQQQNDFSRNVNGISFTEECNDLMSQSTFSEILTEAKFNKIQKTIELKSQYLFAYLGYLIGEADFKNFLTSWVQKHPHQLTSYEEFRLAVLDRFDQDINSIIQKIYSDTNQAAFEVLDFQKYEVLDEDRKRYQVLLTIKNSGDNDGVLEIKFNTSSAEQSAVTKGENSSDELGALSVIEKGKTKQFGFLLNEHPKEATINTIISQNIPSVIYLPFGELSKKNNASLFVGERVIHEINSSKQYQVIVDNEDPGFTTFSPIEPTYLRAFLDERDTTERKYYGNWHRSYAEWRATTGSDFYGSIVRSAHFTRAGKGEKTVTWTPKLEQEGIYDLYVYLKGPNQNEYIQQGKNLKYHYYYIINHGDGTDDIQYDLSYAETGWNYLGSYYFDTEGGNVSQTDASEFRTVYADAIKWVKQ